MKAKTMLGLIACASACVSLSAFGNETNGWFGVTVENSNVTLSHISKSGGGTVSGNQINLEDVEQGSALVFTPESGEITNRTDDIYVIGASVVLTPCSTNDFTDSVAAGAKAGIVAGIDDHDVTNYYGYANGVWIKLEESTVGAPGSETTFCIVLNYRDGKANFMIDESDGEKWYGPYDMPTGGASALANIKVWGTGSISSVTGAFEVAVAAYGGNKYGSVADAKHAGGDENDIKQVSADGSVTDKTTADNGLSVAVCTALGLNIDAPSANITVAPVAIDEDSSNITLALTLPNVPEPDAVGFKINGEDPVYGADAIKIPLTAGTYTIIPVLK